MKSGFILICGIPNAGKSTFLNMMIGEKISGVTDKPQTTRKRIKGIYTSASSEIQLVFIDTPGFHKSNTLFNRLLNDEIFETTTDIDCFLFIMDGSTGITDDEKELLASINELVSKHSKPAIAIVNKTDLGINKEKMDYLRSINLFKQILQISCLTDKTENQKKDKNLEISQKRENISRIIANYLDEQSFFYPEDQLSDISEKEQVEEIIQEKLYLYLHQEIPYKVFSEVLLFKEDEDKIYIDANICCEKESQKPIIIGKNAEVIKKVRLSAEKDLKFIFGKKVKLNLFVKVSNNWTKNKMILKDMGYNIRK
ncbi:MAG TPA: GTPase Era [Exilispira sp.]|nr:GTPase Era [Exilispira sp.]HPO60116.1 GTPase Era [Exilispira sp.]HQJ40266.1 GTPase Era [Exilispira sp.]